MIEPVADPEKFLGGLYWPDLWGLMRSPQREDNAVMPPHTQKVGVKYKRTSEASLKVFQFWTLESIQKIIHHSINILNLPMSMI